MNRSSKTLREKELERMGNSQVEAFYEEQAKIHFGVRRERIMRK